MQTTDFRAIEDEFVARVHRMVWCTFATVDPQGHPRSRLLHSIWEGATGWIATRPQSPKARDLATNPHVSLAYTADVVHPVYVSGIAAWVEEEAIKRAVWQLFQAAPPPLGYDPTPIFGSADAPEYGVLRITPLRIELGDVSGTGERRIVWYAPSSEEGGGDAQRRMTGSQ